MKTYDVICPHCGQWNESLYLDDSKGWMECEECGSVSRVRRKQGSVSAQLRVIPGGLLKNSAPEARIGA